MYCYSTDVRNVVLAGADGHARSLHRYHLRAFVCRRRVRALAVAERTREWRYTQTVAGMSYARQYSTVSYNAGGVVLTAVKGAGQGLRIVSDFNQAIEYGTQHNQNWCPESWN